MVSIKDKLSFFKKIVEDEVAEDFRDKTEKLKAHYAKEEALLQAEQQQQTRQAADQAAFESQRLAREARARKQLAERRLLRQIEQAQMAELLEASRAAITKARNENSSDYIQSVKSALDRDGARDIYLIEGPEGWSEAVTKTWPEATYKVRPIDGLILYADAGKLRYDYTLSSRIDAVLPRLSALYREAMGDVCQKTKEGRNNATDRH